MVHEMRWFINTQLRNYGMAMQWNISQHKRPRHFDIYHSVAGLWKHHMLPWGFGDRQAHGDRDRVGEYIVGWPRNWECMSCRGIVCLEVAQIINIMLCVVCHDDTHILAFGLVSCLVSLQLSEHRFGEPWPPTLASPPSLPRPSHSLCIIVMSRAICAFSNRSDEDDLPPDLAEAVGATTATTTNTTQVSVPLASPKIQKVSSPQKSEVKSPLSPGAKVWEEPEA